MNTQSVKQSDNWQESIALTVSKGASYEQKVVTVLKN